MIINSLTIPTVLRAPKRTQNIRSLFAACFRKEPEYQAFLRGEGKGGREGRKSGFSLHFFPFCLRKKKKKENPDTQVISKVT